MNATSRRLKRGRSIADLLSYGPPTLDRATRASQRDCHVPRHDGLSTAKTPHALGRLLLSMKSVVRVDALAASVHRSLRLLGWSDVAACAPRANRRPHHRRDAASAQ